MVLRVNAEKQQPFAPVEVAEEWVLPLQFEVRRRVSRSDVRVERIDRFGVRGEDRFAVGGHLGLAIKPTRYSPQGSWQKLENVCGCQ